MVTRNIFWEHIVRPKRRNPKKKKADTREDVLTIDRLGRSGDGLSGDIAVPFALPEEKVRAVISGRQGTLQDILHASSKRVEAVCAHFGPSGGECGGCRLQHLGLKASLDWKMDRLKSALDRAGLVVPTVHSYQSPPQTRRRARLCLNKQGSHWQIGFRQWRSHDIVPMQECYILDNELFQIASSISAEGNRLIPSSVRTLDVMLTQTDSGIDAELIGLQEEDLSIEERMQFSDFAHKHDLARLSIDGMPIIQIRTPRLQIADVWIDVPSGTFLQATADGQRYMTDVIKQHARSARNVADLFCGIGTFSFPLVDQSPVLSVDTDGLAVKALTEAARKAQKPIKTVTRDLFDHPLRMEEVDGVDLVIIDPPRAGAVAQFTNLANSNVPIIISVSCNPDSAARDLAILAASYDLVELYLIDQFLWSPHIESIAILHRKEGI